MRGPWGGQGQHPPQQGPSRTRRNEMNERRATTKSPGSMRRQTSRRTSPRRLTNIASEEEDLKNHVLQHIMGTKGSFRMLKPDGLSESYQL